MSASLPADVRHLADRNDQLQQSPVPASVPVRVAGAHLLPVTESPMAAQFAGIGHPQPPSLQLRYVPSSPSTSVSVVADAYSSSSSGSSTCGGAGYAAGSLGVQVPVAPTRRSREFIPESKKDGEYWMKRQKNNEAAKRSREKRRANDAVMMRRIHELAAENKRLKLELDVLRRQLGLMPTVAESHLPSAAAASTFDATASDDALTSARQKQEPAPTVMTNYDDATSGSCRSMMEPVRGEQNQRPEEPHLLRRHPAFHHQSAEWPTTCSVSVSFSTSPSDASLPAYRHSTSGNFLPSIRDLCGRALRQDGGGGGHAPAWSSYRSMTDSDRSTTCQAPPPLPPTPVDTASIVIFSDVSSSGDDSVDEALYGRHVDTLTVRPSAEPVGGAGALESPLNLSTPSRHHSPALTSHACVADSGAVARRSSVEFVPVVEPLLPIKTESELESAVVERHGDGVLITGRANYACEPESATPNAAEWLEESRNGSQWSRSTSLSSVASVAWPTAVDVGPSQPDVPPLQLPAGAGRQVRCGLPLKVRRKFVSASSTGGMIVDDAARALCDECPVGVTGPMWSSEQRRSTLSSGTPCSVSPEWFRSTTNEHSRLRVVSDFEASDPGDGR